MNQLKSCSVSFFCAPVRFLCLVSPLIYQYYWSYLNFVFDLCSKKQTGNRSANSVTTKTHLATYKATALCNFVNIIIEQYSWPWTLLIQLQYWHLTRVTLQQYYKNTCGCSPVFTFFTLCMCLCEPLYHLLQLLQGFSFAQHFSIVQHQNVCFLYTLDTFEETAVCFQGVNHFILKIKVKKTHCYTCNQCYAFCSTNLLMVCGSV